MLKNIYKNCSNSVNNIIVQAPASSNVQVNELQLIVKLPSIDEMPLYADDALFTPDQRDSLFWKAVLQAKNKRVTTYFNRGGVSNRLIEFIIFNRQPYYFEDLLVRYTSVAPFMLEAGSSISLQIEATNSGLLGTGDSLVVWGNCEIMGL